MALEDRYVTATPEGVSLDTVLAGLGSRFFAYLIDLAIQVAVLYAGGIALGLAADHSGSTTSHYVYVGLWAALVFLDYFGYFVLCELVSSGRSPGKRAAGIRVVRAGGEPVTFRASLLRNLLRLIDGFPQPLSLIGSVLIVCTPLNQRLGDLLGGTVVVRERRGVDRAMARAPWGAPALWGAPGAPWGAPALWGGPGAPGAPALWGGPGVPGAGWGWGPYASAPSWGPPPEATHWDVSAVSRQDAAVVETFLERRYGYAPDARMRLARDLMVRVSPLVRGPTGPMEPERFLELVVMVKAARG